MHLNKLDIHHVRNILHASIEPCKKMNLIVGQNGSGKSSLLEAIYILGRTKSFRSHQIKQVINGNKDELIVSALCEQTNGQCQQIGIQQSTKHYQIKINQIKSDKAELAYSIPVQLIHPKSYKLLDDGPHMRREFLDWGAFNHFNDFLPAWRNFRKALKQRNSLLKTKQSNQLNVWNTELAQYGTIVSEIRHKYLNALNPFFKDICRIFLDLDDIQLDYQSGWNSQLNLMQALADDQDRDLHYGYTHNGPHRSDFLLTIYNQPVREFASRGQIKLLVLALKLAQVKLIHTLNNKQVCVLIDDITAELDNENKAKLLAYLSSLDSQIFIATTELSNFGDLTNIDQHKVFHVEHGNVTEYTNSAT